ncbi:MAG: chemotaxis protein CheC [Candidatus Omnitrophica bacterium]|nr:chemotaxis protein CheC [Candidatus Omnitrophota bacterium]
MQEREFNHIQLDALREINSIACGNAATSLSEMLKRKVDVSVPRIRIEAVEKVPEALGGAQKIVDAVYFSVSGRLAGSILLIFPHTASLNMAALLTGEEPGREENLDEFRISAVKEMGNITVGWYTRALADMLKVRVTYSIPGFACDMLGAVLDGILARLALKSEYAVISENEFKAEALAHKMDLVFIPEPEALKFMLKALGAGKKR